MINTPTNPPRQFDWQPAFGRRGKTPVRVGRSALSLRSGTRDDHPRASEPPTMGVAREGTPSERRCAMRAMWKQ